MFKKLVTNLPYSPGLLNQVGFYSKRLRQEEFIRRMGMIFGILALLLNLNLSLFAPEASVQASPANDVIHGGIYGGTAGEMQTKAINAMRNNAHTKAIFNYYGITESDIRKTNIGYLNTADSSLRSVGRLSIGRGAESCYSHQGQTFCERSMHAAYSYRTKNVKALVGVRYDKITKSDPWFAIAESCGNVIIRVGKQEDISVHKLLSPDQGNVVKAGDIVNFRLKVKSNNANPAAFPSITDTLPEHTTYVDHSPKDMFTHADVNGRTVVLTNKTGNLYGLGPYEERVIELKVRILSTAPAGAKLCNQASAKSLGDNAISTSKPCVDIEDPVPEPVCTSLRMIGAGGTNQTRTFEAKVDADGATVKSYTFSFGDGESETVNSSALSASVNHTYEPGSYEASVRINTSEGTVGGNLACMTKLRVDPPVPQPAVTCDYIKLLRGDGNELNREFEVSATPQNGATVNSFLVNFGDGQQATVTNTDSNKNTIEHTYDVSGQYTVRVSANTSLGSVTNSGSCLLEIDIEPQACEYNPELPEDDPNCVPPPEPCEHDSSLPKDDPNCVPLVPNIIKLKTAANITQGIDDAHGTVAKAGDSITYTLVTENDGTGVQEDYIIRETLGDVLQYAEVVDLDGGQINDEDKVVTWPEIDIAPGERVEKTVTVRIMSPIPDTPVSASDSLAYDLRMENGYGNNVTIKLPKSAVKQVEETVTTLPNTGSGTNMLISTLFIMVVSYFYFRNRLISKELNLIKKEFSGGVI